MAKPTPETELAWAAGFFDGEGNVSCTPRASGYYVRVQIDQKDRGVLDRFAAAVGCGKIYGPYITTTGHSHFRYSVQHYHLIKQVHLLLLPYLSDVKVKQFADVLEKTGIDNFALSENGRSYRGGR